MGMPAQQTEWTADLARALPDDGKRYEVLDGALFVTPAPSARISTAGVLAHGARCGDSCWPLRRCRLP
jgi:hypothetical protein